MTPRPGRVEYHVETRSTRGTTIRVVFRDLRIAAFAAMAFARNAPRWTTTITSHQTKGFRDDEG